MSPSFIEEKNYTKKTLTPKPQRRSEKREVDFGKIYKKKTKTCIPRSKNRKGVGTAPRRGEREGSRCTSASGETHTRRSSLACEVPSGKERKLKGSSTHGIPSGLSSSLEKQEKNRREIISRNLPRN